MNLEEQLRREFTEHSEFWNYYRQDIEFPFKSSESAKLFINNYFMAGSKEYAVYEWREFDGEELSFRNTHTINVFFIGAMLQRMIDPNLSILSEVVGTYPFSYLWYLTCLAHDFGYIYEHKKDPSQIKEIKEKYRRLFINEKRKIRCFRLLLYRSIKIHINWLVPNIPFEKNRCYFWGFPTVGKSRPEHNCNHSCREHLKYSNGIEINSPQYCYSLKENYFKYRLLEMDTMDHGIVGADKLFSSLVDNYKNEFNKNFSDGNFENFNNNQGRHFCCEHFKVFAYIADSIAAHNVFMAQNTAESKHLYSEYGLERLWPENFRKIAYKDNPLLFVLCVADTLEPSKRFREIENMNLLKNIGISYDKDSNSVCVKIRKGLLQSKEGERYVNDIKSLDQWCLINVNVVII